MEKLFDDKMAASDQFSYAGGAGGERWRLKVRGYWVSRCPILVPTLDWVEKRDVQNITLGMLCGRPWRGKRISDVQMERLNELIWGFLNTCLKDSAHTVFENVELLNGLDAWRAVVLEIHRGQGIRLAQLRKIVRNPPSISKVEDVAGGILRFENAVKEYAAVGGDAPNDKELKSDLLDTLPQELRENLMWRQSGATSDESFTDFKNHVRTAANNVLYHRGKANNSINTITGDYGG